MTETPRPSRPPPPPPQMSTWEANRPPQMSTWEPQTTTQPAELEVAPLTIRQLKHRRNKDSKLNKKFMSLEAEIDKLKSQMGCLKDRISKASESTNARFKRKKIRSMKREADKINEKLATSEAKLEYVKPRVTINPIHRAPLNLHPLNRSKCIEVKIPELNKKIRRVKNRRNKEHLIAKREAVKT